MQSMIYDESQDPYMGDINARRMLTPPHATHIDACLLTASTAKRMAIPEGARYANFSATSDFWMQFGNSSINAAIPSADVAGTASALNPGVRSIPLDATHVSLIAPTSCIVTIEYWS